MLEKYVTYFEASTDSILLQVKTVSREDYIEKLLFLEEKFEGITLIFREWSDGTEEDGEIDRKEWF